jgi:23S rRNA pseudouridine1911/1915/1917 synthase
LHAWQLGLVHPATRRSMRWRADLPADMADLMLALGFGQDAAAFDVEDGDEDEAHESEAGEPGYDDESDVDADVE